MKDKKSKKKEKSNAFKATLSAGEVLSNAIEAKNLYGQSRYGEIIRGKVHYPLVEALYLLEKGKLNVIYKGKKISADFLMNESKKLEENFFIRYCVFSDLRNRGYIVKTALKFGADFRVYEKGKKPGEEHAKWIVYPVKETGHVTWYEFAAKSRVAHSTRKNLLIAIVDEEGDVTFYEISWIRP